MKPIEITKEELKEIFDSLNPWNKRLIRSKRQTRGKTPFNHGWLLYSINFDETYNSLLVKQNRENGRLGTLPRGQGKLSVDKMNKTDNHQENKIIDQIDRLN